MSEDLNPGATAGGNQAPPAPMLPETLERSALERLIAGRSANPAAIAAREPLRSFENSTADPEACPQPSAWALLLSDQLDAATQPSVSKLLAHAASCAACAQRLRHFSSAPSPEEVDLVSRFASAAPARQDRLAAALARTPHQAAHKPAMRVYLWMGAGLAASLLIALGLTTWWLLANNPERLLAQAYSRSRTFDLRMPGAGFAEIAPPLHLRGGPAARAPSKLLEARAGIQKRLEAAPQDAHWLQLQARSDVLEEQFDPAIQILERLVAAGPVTSTLLLDDASAYFERGQFTGSDSDRATSVDYFRRADEMAPGDPVVLFNEALAMEDRGQLMNAVETWNRYLRFERDPQWLAEGRTRLAALEKKLNELKTHQSRTDQHTDAPQAMAAREEPGPWKRHQRSVSGSAIKAPCPVHSLFSGEWAGNLNPQLAVYPKQSTVLWERSVVEEPASRRELAQGREASRPIAAQAASAPPQVTCATGEAWNPLARKRRLPRRRWLGELIHAEPELVALSMRQQFLPGYFAARQPSHASHHAAQRRLHARGNLVVTLARGDALYEGPLLVAIGERQVVIESPIGSKLS